ncbi:hypothetical protein [uncultured Desulfobulbus sp.]|uniref:hypothetical protein n=1 Tax=uncultured Desulfobulbus sp. TaxID=239745 RepID=UPI0029C60A41|nr:hypothetical protein [uncultured Desulfobulbus sp.]
MISKKQVDAAVASAKEAIRPDADLSWVTRSALMERAYFLGLYAGLRSIANEDDLRGLVLKTITNTMFSRNGDDFFTSTSLGKVFNALQHEILYAERQIVNPESIDSLRVGIEEIDHRWKYNVNEAEELTEALRRTIQASTVTGVASPTTDREERDFRHRCCQMLQHLEKCIRFLSLPQTDHRKWRSFDE